MFDDRKRSEWWSCSIRSFQTQKAMQSCCSWSSVFRNSIQTKECLASWQLLLSHDLRFGLQQLVNFIETVIFYEGAGFRTGLRGYCSSYLLACLLACCASTRRESLLRSYRPRNDPKLLETDCCCKLSGWNDASVMWLTLSQMDKMLLSAMVKLQFDSHKE